MRIPIEEDGITAYLIAASRSLNINKNNLTFKKIVSKSLDTSNTEQFYYEVYIVVSTGDRFDNKDNFPIYTEAIKAPGKSITRKEKPMAQFRFELGEELKDRITGFQGIVIARSQYLTGCNRYSLQKQKLNKDGKPEDWQAFDEDMLIHVGPGINAEKDRKRGGPPQLEAQGMRRQ